MKSVTRNMLVFVLLAVLCVMFLLTGCKGASEAVLKTGTATPKSGEMKNNPIDGAEMVWVPAGEFTMGSTDEQAAAELDQLPQGSRDVAKLLYDREKPQRKVYLDGYWMYKTEVTVAQYRRFCEATKRKMPEAPEWGWIDNHPIVNVNWQDACDYSKWAKASLPTEAQWEKASRGTDGRKYPWGNEWDASKCANGVTVGLTGAVPVGRYATDLSPYGCLDMAGNVKEWCLDWYDPNYYETAPTRNPQGPPIAVQFEIPQAGNVPGDRVLRGGSRYFTIGGFFRCAYRDSDDPANRDVSYGFRCANTK